MLWVICARVKFGSIVTTVGWREIFESFHFCGRNIFQLRILVSAKVYDERFKGA